MQPGTVTGVKIVTESAPATISSPSYYYLGTVKKVLVTQKTKISVTIDMTAWERVDKSETTHPISSAYPCGHWDTERVDLDLASLNACCHTYTKTFDICEVNSCTYGGVTLSGSNIIDPQTVEVGKKVDTFAVSIDKTDAPIDLACSCPYYAVMMYMVDGSGNLLPDAFTVDTWGGTSATGGMIWYNPQNAPGPDIPDQPVQHSCLQVFIALILLLPKN